MQEENLEDLFKEQRLPVYSHISLDSLTRPKTTTKVEAEEKNESNRKILSVTRAFLNQLLTKFLESKGDNKNEGFIKPLINELVLQAWERSRTVGDFVTYISEFSFFFDEESPIVKYSGTVDGKDPGEIFQIKVITGQLSVKVSFKIILLNNSKKINISNEIIEIFKSV